MMVLEHEITTKCGDFFLVVSCCQPKTLRNKENVQEAKLNSDKKTWTET